MGSEALNRKFIYFTRRALVISVCIHLAIPVAYVTDKVLEHFGIHLIPGKKPINTTEMYQSYIQVDVVGLPDELMNQRTNVDPTLPIVEKPAAEPEPKPIEKKDDSMQIEMEKKAAEEKAKSEKAQAEKEAKAKAEEKAAEEKKKKVEQERALKKLQKEAEREAALKSLQSKGKEKGRAKIAGNIKSKGTAMSGMIGTAKDRYVSLVQQKIREHFNIFPWQKKKGLAAVVFIEIAPNGRLKDKKLMKASRDPVFDAAVLQAVEDAQPLPVPEDMSFVANGITLDFRPEVEQ